MPGKGFYTTSHMGIIRIMTIEKKTEFRAVWYMYIVLNSWFIVTYILWGRKRRNLLSEPQAVGG